MPPDLHREWLKLFDWDYVTQLNAMLCQQKSALHRPTSDGHDVARDLWESSRMQVMSLEHALSVCHQCHRMGPFCSFNGNTFSAIARGLIKPILGPLALRDPMQAAAFRSIVGHFVAGTEGLEELRTAIHEALDALGGQE
jgi:hypothetical protein